MSEQDKENSKVRSKTIAVNFSQPAATSQVLSKPNVMSSHAAGWTGMHLEYHRSGSHETPEHYPRQHVIAIQTEGVVSAERKLGDRFRREQISAGDICVVPAYTRHWIYTQGDQDLILLSLEPSFVDRTVANSFDLSQLELLPHFAQSDPLIHHLGVSLKTALQTDSAGSRFYAEALSIALIAHLMQFYTAQKIPVQSQQVLSEDARVQQAKDYIQAHLMEELSLDAIATTLGISQHHFCRVFKHHTGLTPWQYVIQQRIEAAKRLLRLPELSIIDISSQLGYSTSAQFTTFFRKHTGITPSAYRQKL
jgi:AraC family transcriptional regulator